MSPRRRRREMLRLDAADLDLSAARRARVARCPAQPEPRADALKRVREIEARVREVEADVPAGPVRQGKVARGDGSVLIGDAH
ncbi:MAG TPA: hypothetical protein VMK13_13640 [Streptosporangiaceae bacterium]|nr:hypothetical protein [Streptosporangiaceae bacterium]